MTVHTLQVNGTRGEVTPLMHARVDTDFYQAALAKARNVIISRYGPLSRCPGTLFQGGTKDNTRRSRMLPFEFSETQVYAIEAGHMYFRFWTEAGQVVDGGGVPIEIATPYDEDTVFTIVPVQSADVIYLFAQDQRPQILRRMSETSWSLDDYETKDGPYLDINTTATTLRPQFAALLAAHTSTETGTSGTVAIAASNGVCDSYIVKASPNFPERAPSEWTLEGFDGSAWIALDSQSGETAWARGESRFFEFQNKTSFNQYRFVWAGNNGGGDTNIELRLTRAADDQAPFNLTASSTTGINDGVGFLPSDVDRPIRVLGSDGRWRWYEIESRTSPTVVTVRMHGFVLPDTRPIINWRLGAWSDVTGWPRTGKFSEDRLFLAATDEDPLGLWGSVTSEYDNFRVSTPVVDDDALSLRLTGGTLNAIQWLAESGSLLGGTSGSLRSVGSRDNTNAMTPTNIRQRQETAVPSSAITPLEIENIVMFVNRLQKRIYEAAYSFEADGYLAREASTLNEHLFLLGVEEITYIDEPEKVVICRRTDGQLIGFSYDREQKVVGATLIDFGGGAVESVMALPGTNATNLWMTIRRTVNGQTVRYIERLALFYREALASLGPPVYGACSFVYSGVETGTITGLGALEGETLGIWANGWDVGDAVVTGGNLTLPGGNTGGEIAAGIRMPWEIETLRLSQIGNQDGSGLGRNVRIVNALLDMFESAGVEAGSKSQTDFIKYEDDVEVDPDQPMPLRTGMVPLPIDDSWQNKGVFVIKGDRMYPATFRGISLEVDGEP